MFTLTAERLDGERLTLTQFRSAYTVTYSGFGPVGAQVTTSPRGMSDGDKINSARRGGRNAVLIVRIRGNVEQNRIRLYRFFAPGHAVKLYYQNGSRDVYTEGTVEAFDDNQFSAVQTVQISILCESPYWVGTEEIVQDISNVVSAFSFPFSIPAEGVPFSELVSYDYVNMYNSGDEPSGFTVTIFARENVTAPMIYNAITNDVFRVTGVLEKGHTLTITTTTGSKRVTITDPSGVVTNAIHRKQVNSVWLQLAAGNNYIAYAAESGVESMLVTLRHRDIFVGV
jgi:hypothetical protein